MKTETVEYRDGDAVLEGFVVTDPHLHARRPGVLVAHEWWGQNDYARRRAVEIAGLGYVAFALDVYGRGVRAKSREEAGQLASRFMKDRAILRSRARAALQALRRHPLCDGRIAAVGYCFGGTTVLELARSGANVAGVVSFHGALLTPNPADAKRIRGKILVLHGAEDPFVPPSEVDAFYHEMRAASIDWQFVSYGGAVHGFTNPEAGSDKSTGAAYHERADRRSWNEMNLFLEEIFA